MTLFKIKKRRTRAKKRRATIDAMHNNKMKSIDKTRENLPKLYKRRNSILKQSKAFEGRQMVDLDDTPMEKANTPLIAPAGTLVVLHGRLPHLSGTNSSPNSRHAYALHVIDGRTDYPKENWLQRDENMPLRSFC